jgi:translation initiation factor 3 subunit L
LIFKLNGVIGSTLLQTSQPVRNIMTDSLDFALPNHIRDFVFDLHELTRVTFRSEDLSQIYEVTFKELTEKFFPQSQWPDARTVSPECNSDDKFLLFYR